MNIRHGTVDAHVGKSRRRPASRAARPGTVVAAGLPVALAGWSVLPGYRPAPLVPLGLALLGAAVLVLAAQLASADQPRPAPPARVLDLGHHDQPLLGSPEPDGAPPGSPPGRWSDPALVGVGRWLAHWPGIAGVNAASWWAARTGAAGLLCALGLEAAGAPHALAWAAVAAAVVTGTALLPAGRHLVHLSVALVTVVGAGVSLSGLVALGQGHLTGPLLPHAPWWPRSGSLDNVAVQATTTVVLLCLGAVSLPSMNPTSRAGGRKARRALVWAGLGTAVTTWYAAVPALLWTAGLSRGTAGGQGGVVRALVAASGRLLQPLGGGDSRALAQAVLVTACLAGALGLAGGANGVAVAAVGTARAARGGRHGTSGASARAVPAPGGTGLARPALLIIALLGAGAAAGAAVGGLNALALITLGSLAASAMALTALAPPALPRVEHLPGPVRAAVAATWALAVTVAVGSAGPVPLVVVGVTALAGAFAVGWRGQAGGGRATGGWRPHHVALPWSTAAAALVVTAAVTGLEAVPQRGAGAPALWRGLAVVVMGAGVVVLAVFPATWRRRSARLAQAAEELGDTALPAVAGALEALARGEPAELPVSQTAHLQHVARVLEGELSAQHASDEAQRLTEALLTSLRQANRVAVAARSVAQLGTERLERLVERRTTALANVNRHLVDSQLRRRQVMDRTVRVAEGERARIAANLHDGPIQRLAAVGLVLDRCLLRLERSDPEAAHGLVTRARSELSAEIQGLRQMMSELRPPILDQGGLDAALRDHVAAWSAAHGTEARFESIGQASLSADSETVIYRIVQEALANVAKHAKASLTTVVLSASGNGAQVSVRDNGKGFVQSSQPDLLRGGHFGLVVMRERVELAAGRFEVRSAPHTGTEVTVWLPGVPVDEHVGAM